MLVLSRKQGESICVGANVVIRVVRVKGGQVRIGIEAPKETKILREEISDGPRHSDDVAVQFGDHNQRDRVVPMGLNHD